MPFNDWENILSEIIVGDSFGVHRIDYLLRDSYHTGVAYGRFDHHRFIDTLRILPPPPYGHNEDISMEPSLGVEEGGIQSTEALLLARYFMYTQVYFHHVRRIYDIHLRDFLIDFLAGGQYPTGIEPFLQLSDNEITSYLRTACSNKSAAGHAHAKRIINREHFKRLYSRVPIDVQTNSEAPELIKEAAIDKFGEEKIRFDSYPRKDGRIVCGHRKKS